MPRRIEFPGYRMRMDEVRRELKANGTTQQQLAEKAALPAWQVSHLLNGGLPEDIEDFRRFAEALEKPLGWFFLDEREIEALIEFHGHGPSRGKAPRRQGRRTAGSLVLALMAGAGSLLGFGPPSGRGAAEAAVQRPAYIIRREALNSCFYSPYAVSLLGRRFASWLWNCTVSPVAA